MQGMSVHWRTHYEKNVVCAIPSQCGSDAFTSVLRSVHSSLNHKTDVNLGLNRASELDKKVNTTLLHVCIVEGFRL